MNKSGMKLRVPVVGRIGSRSQLLMPDGTPVPQVRSVRMIYEPGDPPLCVVELYGVEVEHVDEAD